jgi:hypothetical protein
MREYANIFVDNGSKFCGDLWLRCDATRIRKTQNTLTHVHTHSHSHIHNYTRTHTLTHTRSSSYTHTHTRSNTHTHTHTRTHAHTNARRIQTPSGIISFAAVGPHCVETSSLLGKIDEKIFFCFSLTIMLIIIDNLTYIVFFKIGRFGSHSTTSQNRL